MYGQYRNSGVRRIHDYAQALEQFNTTKPIRGRTDPSKPQVPLGHRNKIDHYSIRKCPFTQDIECVLYQTPVVTYKTNGEVVIKSDGWESISTASFIEEVTGMPAYIFDRNLCVGIYNENGMQTYRVPVKGELVFKKDGRFQYVRGAVESFTHKVNRKAINAVRKQYAEFKKYAIGMAKLRGDTRLTGEEADAVGIGRFDSEYTAISGYTWRFDTFGRTVLAVKHWMDAKGEDKYEQFYKAYVVFASSYGQWGTITPKALEDGFNQFTLGLHRDEVLIAEPVPMGTVKRDNYSKYWGKAWGTYHATKPEGFELTNVS